MNNVEIKNQLDLLLKQLSTERSFDVAEKIATKLADLLNIKTKDRFLANISRVDAELTRFQLAPGFARQAAAYELPHEDNKPFDLKLFWIKKASKTNLSWIIGLTPNFEDAESNDYKNIGIDFVVPETCDSIIILLSNRFKIRALELKDHITPTQLEIFTQWIKLPEIDITDQKELKKTLHAKLWESFNFEPINRKFYLELVEHFSVLVHHLEKDLGRKPSVMFTTRLIGRLLFIWFLKKKNLINKNIDYFAVPNPENQTDYYKNQLEKLFFEVLNTNELERTNGDKLTPYLNGGLFDKNTTDFFGDPKLTFPNGYFNQIFNTLNKYNFTVDESSPEFQHVAIDPEMLGRIFESLLAEQIDENTGNSKKKATGAFYTPREIVSYMCEQSLIEYLKTKVIDAPDRDRRIDELLRLPETIFRDQDQNKRDKWRKNLGKDNVLNALDEILILDPAVGSGAFPMGMLHLLVKVYSRLDPKFEKDISGLKRDILSRSLYGVDIEQTAIEITRLRAWLSIIVDIPEGEKVEPLPNLEFKFVCANTLIPLDDSRQATFFTDHDLKDKLITIRDDYFKTSSKTKKEKLQKDYLKLTQNTSLFDNKKTQQLKSYKPFDISSSSEFYDPELMHGVHAFDIVIGNPPWVSNDSINVKTKNEIIRVFSYSAKSRFDLSCPFIEIALEKITKKLGVVAYVLPEHLWIGEYFVSLRKAIYKKVKEVTSLKEGYFESVNNPASMVIFTRADNSEIIVGKSKSDMSIERATLSNNFISEETLLDSREKIIYPHKIYFDLDYIKIKAKIIKQKDVSLLGQICVVTDGVQTANVLNTIMTNVTPIDQKKYYKALRRGASIPNTYGYAKWDGWWILKPEYADTYKKPGYSYNSPKRKYCFESDQKIILRQTEPSIVATIDNDKYRFPNSIFQIVQKKDFIKKVSLFYLLGLINSKFIRRYYSMSSQVEGTTKPQIYINILKSIPIKISENYIVPIEKIVSQILTLKKQKKDADVKHLESQIDQLVYKLYDLTPEEIKIVENSTKK